MGIIENGNNYVGFRARGFHKPVPPNRQLCRPKFEDWPMYESVEDV